MNLGFGTWALGLRIPNGYAMSPPDLPADAPILNLLEPLCVDFFPVCGKETDQMIAHDGERLLRFRITEKPLLAQAWLDRHFTALAEADVICIWFCLRK